MRWWRRRRHRIYGYRVRMVNSFGQVLRSYWIDTFEDAARVTRLHQHSWPRAVGWTVYRTHDVRGLHQ